MEGVPNGPRCSDGARRPTWLKVTTRGNGFVVSQVPESGHGAPISCGGWGSRKGKAGPSTSLKNASLGMTRRGDEVGGLGSGGWPTSQLATGSGSWYPMSQNRDMGHPFLVVGSHGPHLTWSLKLGAPGLAFETWETFDVNSPATGTEASRAIDVPAALPSRGTQLRRRRLLRLRSGESWTNANPPASELSRV